MTLTGRPLASGRALGALAALRRPPTRPSENMPAKYAGLADVRLLKSALDVADKAISAQIAAGDQMKKAEALEKTGDPAAKKKAYGIYSEVAKKQKGTKIGEKAQAAADRLKSS